MLSSFSPPSSSYLGRQGLLLNSFSIERTVQCDGCLIWVLDLGSGVAGGARGWVASRAGLWGCPTDLGLGCWGQSPDP